MRPNYKPKLDNRPPHLKIDDSFYFLTCRTIDGQWFLKLEKYRQILWEKIKEKTDKFGFSLIAYTILQNHYHLILKVPKSAVLAKFMAELNGASSFAINRADGVTGRKIWWNYYDHIIRDEADFFKHLNYLHQNPIKHGTSKDFDYKFSSYNTWEKQKGKEYMADSFTKYPIIDFKTFNDEF